VNGRHIEKSRFYGHNSAVDSPICTKICRRRWIRPL